MPVFIRLDVFLARFGFLIHFLPVLIGAGRKKDAVARQAPVSGYRIGVQDLKSKTDMRLCVHIRKRRGDVQCLSHEDRLAEHGEERYSPCSATRAPRRASRSAMHSCIAAATGTASRIPRNPAVFAPITSANMTKR